MPIRNHTGRQFFRLKGNAGQTQTASAGGGELSWLLNSVPKITDGKLCNYLLGLVVTIVGTLTLSSNVSTAATAYTMHRIVRKLIESVELRACWHGTVLSSQHVKGAFLELMEFVGNGLERPFRQRMPIGFANGGPPTNTPSAENFRINLWVPCSLLVGRKGHHTAQPVALYDDAEFVINTLALVTGAEDEVAFSNVTFDVSADVLPDREVRLGPGVEWIDYQQKTSGEAVDVQNLGRTTTLDRTETGAGIAGLFYLSKREGLPGPVDLKTMTRITFPFRGLVSTTHVDPVLLQMETMVSGNENPVVGAPAAAGNLGPMGQDDVGSFPQAFGDIGLGGEKPDPVVLALVCPSRDLETSKVQVSEGTQQLQIQFDPQPTEGTHHVLACQLHSWTPEGFLSAKQKLIDTGVCRAVLKTDDVTWSLKVINKQNPLGIAKRKQRFFAMRLVPNTVADPKVA